MIDVNGTRFHLLLGEADWMRARTAMGEPAFPPEDFAALRAVGEASGIPIAAGENLCFATQFKAAFDMFKSVVLASQHTVDVLEVTLGGYEIASDGAKLGFYLAKRQIHPVEP